MPDAYQLEFFTEDDGTKPVLAWIKNDLTTTQRRALGVAMRHVLQVNGIGVCANSWGRQLGNSLFEFRVRLSGRQVLTRSGEKPGDIDPSERVLLRVFCHAYGDRIILLLGGYDKGSDPTSSRQNSEIAVARARLKRHRTRRSSDARPRRTTRRR